MQNFVFDIPTKVIFGRGQISKIGTEIKKQGVKKLLMVYGQGAIKKNGIYQQVTDALNSVSLPFVEIGGVRSNPVLSFVRQGTEFAKREKVDAIVAVGGGSVIDTAKAIAAGVKAGHDVWDFFVYKEMVKQALPLFCVLTVAASASEMNSAAVITNEDTSQKFSMRSPFLAPKVSILDPTALFSLPPEYTAYSAVDIITHLLEGYFNNTASSSPIQDDFVHTLIKTVMTVTETLLKEPQNYDARANFMWSASLGFNGLTTAGMGAIALPVHMFGHSLSALYDVAHGASLSIMLPAWMTYFQEEKAKRLTLFSQNVFGYNNPAEGIAALKKWFATIGAPISFNDVGISASAIPVMAQNAFALAQVWSLKDYDIERNARILELCR